MTTRKPLLLTNVHGMSSTRPDLISPERWAVQRNMRSFAGRLVQTERKKILTRVEAGHKHELVMLATLPTKNSRRQVLFGLTKKAGYWFSSDFSQLTKMTCKGLPTSFATTGNYERWDYTTYNGHVYFVNPENKVMYTDGTEVFPIGGQCPAGRYVEVWYDRLVVGAPLIDGHLHSGRVAFSHLYDFLTFRADTTNEATSRDFTDYDADGTYINGVTGVRRLGNRLIVYTDSCVYAVDYVGMPHVIQTNPIIEGTGNSLHHAVVSTKLTHYFFNVRNRQFYALSTGGVEQIGEDIAEYLFPMFDALEGRTPTCHGWHDSKHKEIWWAFDFSAEHEYTFAVVYNYQLKEWFIADLENVHSFAEVAGVATRFDELGVGYDTLGDHTCVGLGSYSDSPSQRVWGGAYGRVYSPTDNLDTAVSVASAPLLESGDFHFNSTVTQKDFDQLGLNTNQELQVWIGLRDQFHEPVEWTYCGLWYPGRSITFNFPRKAGRIVRWRFQPKVSTTEENEVVTNGSSERLMQLFGDGFNGPVTALAVRSDGKIYVAGEFTTYRGAAAVGIARINTDGTLDTAFNPGAGFAPGATRIPPTQLVVAEDGGVWCALSTPRVVEAYTGRSYTGLYFQGSVRSTLIRLSAVGALAYEETDCNVAADISRFFGVQLGADGAVYYAYNTKGASTSNLFWYHLVRKKTGDTTLRRVIKSSSGLAAAIGDIALVGEQVFWSCPKALTGSYNDIADESGSSILTGTVWEDTLGLGYFVLDATTLTLQRSWLRGATSPDGYVNPVAFGWRVERGGFNNVYAAYFPAPSGSFTNGRFGLSLPWQHRGLYQLNLGSKDVISGGSFYKENNEFVGTGGGWIWYVPNVPAGDYFFIGETSDWIYAGSATIRLYEDSAATKLIHEIQANGPGGEWLPFNLPGPGPYTLRVQASDVVQATSELVYVAAIIRSEDGQQVVGITQPNAWNLQGDESVAEADSGFELASTSVDADNTVPLLTPLCTYSNDRDERVYLVGRLAKFKGVEVPVSSIWAVSNTGVLDENFVVTLFNRWLSADGTQRAGKAFTAVQYGEHLLLGGRFTSINNVEVGHLGFINPATGLPAASVVINEGTVAESVSTSTGSVGFEFFSYEQLIYTAAAEQ